MKGVLKSDHIPVNNYELRVTGQPTFTFVNISGIEKVLETIDLPDRTAASGGHSKTIEFTATLPAHHTREHDALERWLQDSHDPVAPDYLKDGTLVLTSISGMIIRNFMLEAIFPCGYKTADLEMGNEGDMHVYEWTFKGTDINPM